MCVRIHSPKVSHVFINSLYICVCDQEQGEERKNRRWRDKEKEEERKKVTTFPLHCATRERKWRREEPLPSSPYNVSPTFGNGSSSSFQWPFSPPHPFLFQQFFHREEQRASSSACRGREKNAIRVAPSTGNLIVPR